MAHMQAGQRGSQMGTGGYGVYCGNNDAQLGGVNLLYHEALGGKYVSRAVLMDLEPGVIDTLSLSRRSASCSAREPREPKRGRGQQQDQGPLHKGGARIHTISREGGVVKPLGSLVRDTRPRATVLPVVKPLDYLVRDTRVRGTAILVSRAELSHGISYLTPPLPFTPIFSRALPASRPLFARDEHGIVGDGEYCGDSDAQLDRINVLYHETSG
jgi:hypothetical protein